MVSYKESGSRFKLDVCVLTQDLEPRPSGQRAVFLLHHSCGLFLFKCKPCLGFATLGHRKWS